MTMLRRSRAFHACGLSMTRQVESAWMIVTVASMESTSVSRCFRWSAGTSCDVADHGSMEDGASSQFWWSHGEWQGLDQRRWQQGG